MCIFVTGPFKVESKYTLNNKSMTKLILQGAIFFVASYEHLLCVQDTYIARFYCLFATRIMSPTMLFKLDRELLVEVYRTFGIELAKYGNEIFKHIK